MKTEISFNDRFEYYKDPKFFEHQIHWFSIFNSFMMVIFLCGLVSLILVRTLKNDFAKVRGGTAVNYLNSVHRGGTVRPWHCYRLVFQA